MYENGMLRKENFEGNRGSAIVTVIVVIAFISILATILLYVSGVNFQMKVTDYSTKVVFYETEETVEEVRTQLVRDLEEAFMIAYANSCSQYIASRDESIRRSEYQRKFTEEFIAIWEKRCPYDSSTGKRAWENAFAEDSTKRIITIPGTGVLKVEISANDLDISGIPVGNQHEGLIFLRGLKVSYTNDRLYTGEITTDFCIEIPKVVWSESTSTGEENASPSQINFDECVTYLNWTKQ